MSSTHDGRSLRIQIWVWGILGGDATQPDGPAISMVTRLREEPIEDTDDDISLALLSDSVGLEQQYRTMLDDLTAAGTTVVRYGNDDTEALLGAFEPIGLSILGPTKNQLQICATAISGGTTAIDEALTPLLTAGPEAVAGHVATLSETDLYRLIMNPPGDDRADGWRRSARRRRERLPPRRCRDQSPEHGSPHADERREGPVRR